MKKTIKFFEVLRGIAIIAMLAVIVLPTVNADDAQKSITVTGIPTTYNGKVGGLTLHSGSTAVAWSIVNMTGSSVTFPLLDYITDTPWGKDGSYSLSLIIYEDLRAAAASNYLWMGRTMGNTNLNQASTTIQYSQFISQGGSSPPTSTGSGAPTTTTTTTTTGTTGALVSAGGTNAMFIKADGSLWAWGRNNFGSTGLGTNDGNTTTPTRVGTDSNWKLVSAGGKGEGWVYNGHTVAIKTDGSLWAWGNKRYGMIGDGTTSTNDDSSVTSPTRIGTDTNWKTISAGGNHTLAIKTDGSLWAWGAQGNGRLGNGQTVSGGVGTPIRVGTDTNWAIISAGASYSVAIKTDGSLWAWGSNTSGQIGDGTTTQRATPVRIGNDTWKSVSAGPYHTLAIRTDGSLWAWGNNTWGQVGDGTEGSGNQQTTPKRIGTATDWAIVEANGNNSGHYSLAIKTNGTLWAWGYNVSGRTGLGTTNGNTTTPTQVGTDTNWASLSAGSNFGLAIKTNGTVWGWGSGSNGRTGQGNTSDRSSPVQITIP